MISILLLSAMVLVAYADVYPTTPVFLAAKEDCKKEFSVSEDMIQKNEKLAGNPRCIFKCMAMKLGVLNDKGDIMPEALNAKEKGPLVDKYVAGLQNCVKGLTKPTTPDALCDFAQDLKICTYKMM